MVLKKETFKTDTDLLNKQYELAQKGIISFMRVGLSLIYSEVLN